jgi:CHAT domain-containing protein/tetratricopeptide (TPR) repeat protein
VAPQVTIGSYRRYRHRLTLLLLLLDITPPGQAESKSLGAGKVVEARLADGESHEYTFTLAAGEYARVLVDQRSVKLTVSVIGVGGEEIFSTDSEAIGETESAEIVAEASGSFRVRLKPSELHPPAGEYAITLKTVEPATERHRKCVVAAGEFARAMTAYMQGTREGMLKALEQLGNALAGWRAAQDRIAESRALVAIAVIQAEAGNEEKAMEYAAQALTAAQDTGDRLVEARALDALGQVQYYFGDKRTAIGYYEQALPLMRAAADRAAEGSTLSNLAVAYSRIGEKRRALSLLEEAMRIFRQLQDRPMIAEVAGNIGATYERLAEYQKALESDQYDLALKQELGDHANEAIAWNNIATAYTGLAAYQKALDAYNAALEINRSGGNDRSVAINLNNIAWVYDQLADHQRALTFYQQSLNIFRKIGDRTAAATTLNNIAENYADLGEYRKAVELQLEALPLRSAAGDADGEANSLTNLGKAYAKLGERVKARDHFEQALVKHRTSGNRHMMARTLRSLGELDSETGDYEHAQQDLGEALVTSRAIHDPNGEAAALADLAKLESNSGNLNEAHRRADEAMAVLESLRLAVASPKLRASFFASARDLQELTIQVLMRLNTERPGEGFDSVALRASERGRARSLLEMLGEGSAEIRRGVDPALLSRERELEQLISGKADLQLSLLGSKHTEADAEAVAKELDTLTAQLDQVQSQIRESSPQYAALTHPAPLDLKEIQTKVLDPDTVLLEYALGTDQSFLWAATPSSLHVFELPPRREIETVAKRTYELLTARNQNTAKDTPAARAARVQQADLGYRTAAQGASRMLLGPVASLIRDKRLLIVGEGVLQSLPLGALPDPNALSVPIAVNHEVVMAPSASLVTVLRQETAGRNPAEKALAVLADPVFSAKDPRLSQESKVGAASTTGPADVTAGEFLRLRFSRTEAEGIARLAPNGSALKALDFEASRDTVLKGDIGRYRILHFATHSILNSAHPELSGVVLSLVDRSGHPQNGFLRLYDIYNLRLASDLVVLSACRTALGGEIQGEGLIGLTRGFLYAGAPRVVATLWEIDDRGTAEMMKRFYEGMLARGERPAAALRAAQIAMWKTKGWDAPYYWAAFTLVGEWR